MSGSDLGLSEAEFKVLVRQLLTSLTYLPWIWRGAESRFVLIVYFKSNASLPFKITIVPLVQVITLPTTNFSPTAKVQLKVCHRFVYVVAFTHQTHCSMVFSTAHVRWLHSTAMVRH